jgi:hypothetical protein
MRKRTQHLTNETEITKCTLEVGACAKLGKKQPWCKFEVIFPLRCSKNLINHELVPADTDVLLDSQQQQTATVYPDLFMLPTASSDRSLQIPTHVYNVKDKAILVQTWTEPEGSSRLWLPDLKTTGT